MFTTCLGCGHAGDRDAIKHAPECPVMHGAEWRCLCEGPCCDDECVGCFQYPDGSYADPVTLPE